MGYLLIGFIIGFFVTIASIGYKNMKRVNKETEEIIRDFLNKE